ncbi:MAG: lipase maturation factor family protein, partial [Acidobacteriales bacterium]|nr:lipase maturation factor family protein [Terriglobales bacterium]
FHWGTAAGTLLLELGIVWLGLLPRRYRLICFFIVTPWQIGVIVTANYTFLNYLVLVLGFLLLDDEFFSRYLHWTRKHLPATPLSALDQEPVPAAPARRSGLLSRTFAPAGFAVSVVLLTWIFYATTLQLLWMFNVVPLPVSPVTALEPFRVANRYGLFAVMTRGRYEIEFQGSDDGEHWTTYPFRFKPQDVHEAPGIYAPYQPRFDWNLWFASLGSWRENPLVTSTEERLLDNAPDVIALFRSNPFSQHPPRQVRAVLWQYWFTSAQEKKNTGNWWRRQYLGLYAPTLQRADDGSIQAVEATDVPPRD